MDNNIQITFLREWIKWADMRAKPWWTTQGLRARKHPTFSAGHGLCITFRNWLIANHRPCERLLSVFGVQELYPFGGQYCYAMDRDHHTMHLNPMRVAWVHEQIAEHDAVYSDRSLKHIS